MNKEAISSAEMHEFMVQGWWLEIAVGLLMLGVIYFVFKRLLRHISHRSFTDVRGWRQKIWEIAFLPVVILLWLLGAILIIEVLSKRFGFAFFDEYLDAFRTSVIVGSLSWLLLRWKREAQHAILEKGRHEKKLDTPFIHVVGRILSIAILLITAMIIMQVWGVNLGPLIAFSGIGAAAIGFAAKDVIGNFFGGLMLYITRPFMVGDLVLLPDRKIEGYIEEIGWYLTAIRDKDKRPVYLPNAIFSNTLVINSSRMTHRRILETVGVRYSDFSHMGALCEELRKKIAHHPAIDTHLPVLVFFNALGSYSLDILIDVYTLATRYDHYLSVKQEILMLVYTTFKEQGIEIPFPTTQVLSTSVN